MKKYLPKILTTLVIVLILSIPIATSLFTEIQEHKKETKEKAALKKIEEGKKNQEKIAEEKIYLTGKFDPSVQENFVLVPDEYTLGKNKMYLRKETLKAFEEMAESAEQEQIELNVASATRNFNYQKNIWNNKWTGRTLVNGKSLAKTIQDGEERFKKILEYSAVPGASRHHWGTDIDINDANTEYFETKHGEEVYEWLVKNAPSFGFCQTYTKKGNESDERETGYNEEKWHWSYTPLSKTFTKEYKDLITDDDIKGFDGDEYTPKLNLIHDYVLGINPECQ